MTARTEQPFVHDLTCCIRGCEKLGAHVVGAQAWSVVDDLKHGKPYKFETGMTVCEEHKGKMPQTCPEFFVPESRERITQAVRLAGGQPPNYNTAEWLFLPLPAPVKTEAN